MSHARYLRDLLRPLGAYDLEGRFGGGELDVHGRALDGAMEELDELWRESLLTTARSWGLENIAQLLARRPVTSDPEQLAAALAALLRIGGDSFTLRAINDTISGCGIPAVVEERGTGRVAVSFPGVAGEPEDFHQLRKIIEDILPTHLAIEYVFWFLTWLELERTFPSWQSIQDRELSWEQLETCVEWI